MRKIKYPPFVNVENVITKPISSDCKYRYVLEIPLTYSKESNCKTVIVILKNPSKANENESDVTITRVCNAAKENGYSHIKIFNMFPYKSTSAKAVKEFIESKKYQKHIDINDKYLKDAVLQVEDIVFAWGTNTISHSKQISMEYQKRKNIIINMCKSKNTLMVNGGTKEPLHGQRWKNDSKFVKFMCR